MILSRVTGTVWATRKDEHLRGNRLLITRPVDLEGRVGGEELLALDVADAGVGDLVLVNKEGGCARIIFNDDRIPLQAVIVGVIDDFKIDPEARGMVGLPPRAGEVRAS